MNKPLHDPRFSRWLAAEAGRDDQLADAACKELFTALPWAGVPAGFAGRVLARVASDATATGLVRQTAWPLERAALWLLAACAGALILLPRWLPGFLGFLAPERWVDGLAALLVRAAHAVAALAPVWDAFARVAHWTALAAGSPQVVTAVALSALLAATAGRLLLGLLDERSSGHAQVG